MTTRDPYATGGGVPVYDERGAPFARSISEAARLLRCHNSAVPPHCIDYRDGLRLVSRPRYAGRRGGARWRAAPPPVLRGADKARETRRAKFFEEVRRGLAAD